MCELIAGWGPARHTQYPQVTDIPLPVQRDTM